jgi:hypothetical protein
MSQIRTDNAFRSGLNRVFLTDGLITEDLQLLLKTKKIIIPFKHVYSTGSTEGQWARSWSTT